MNDKSEAMQLVTGGVASTLKEAEEILAMREERRSKAGIRIFYKQPQPVRQLFPQLVDEKSYILSNIMTACISDGSLGEVIDNGVPRYIALCKIMEFGPKDRESSIWESSIYLVARSDDFPYEGKPGIFLSPRSVEEVHARGSKTYDDQHGLYRIEFKPIAEDYIFGMFNAWNEHPIGSTASLALYISRDKTLEI